MAALAAKSPYPAPLGSASTQHIFVAPSAGMQTRRAVQMAPTNQGFASPTDSEFSDLIDAPDSVKNWDEDRVSEWLHTVNCGVYKKLFRKNNINGENLLEMDKAVLQEMGIEKIGDRVRLFLGIKKLRTKAYANQKKRNRVSINK
jgi:mitogen-activated protein kinase kinase kinase